MKILKKYWHWFLILPISIVFFFLTSLTNYYSHFYNKTGDFVKWTSPDETANYIFSKYYGQEGDIIIKENLNKEVKDIIRPRSFRSDNGDMKPMSFLGIILIYGQAAKYISYKILPYLTPIIGSFGLIFFYLLVRKLFDKRTALVSFLLLAAFPPYFYYTARSMFHNVLFMVFVIIFLYFALMMNSHHKERCINCTNRLVYYLANNWLGIMLSVLSGIFYGLSIAVRTSELIWLGPLLIVLWLFNIKKTGVVKPILFVIATLVVLLPIFKYNTELYGAFYQGGYSQMNSTISNISNDGASLMKDAARGQFAAAKDTVARLAQSVFYFGFKPTQSLWMIKYYLVDMFPWLFWGSMIGGVAYILMRAKKLDKKFFAYVVTYLLTAAILALYYGSWEFHDNPDITQHTIGNSYTRYWLPIYLGLIPFVAWLIWRPAKYILLKKLQNNAFFSRFIGTRKTVYLIWVIFIVAVISVKSISYVTIGSAEGLVYQVSKMPDTYLQWRKVLDLTESNSTIITIYHDKLFFPERKVVVGDFNDPRMVDEYIKILKLSPLYYYNFTLRPNDVRYLNNKKFKNLHLKIIEIEKINDTFTLYQLIGTEKKSEL